MLHFPPLPLRGALAAAALSFFLVPAAQAQASPAAAATTAPAAAAADGSAVVVSGPAGRVTERELQAMVDEVVPPAQRAAFWAKPQSVEHMARTLYHQRALAQTALADGIGKTGAGAEYLNLVRERALSKLWLDHKAQEAKPNARAIADFARAEYRAHPERFQTPEQVHVRHILLPVAKDDSDDAVIKKQAENLMARLREGADFGKLALEYSVDKASAQRGGDLGLFARGKMVAEFEKAAFGLKNPGDLAGPVKTAFGYHIIELVGKKPADAQKVEDVLPQLEQEVTAKIEGQARERLWDAAGAGAQLDSAALKALAERQSR